MYLCICNAITDRQARSQTATSCSVAAFYRALGVKPKCGKCVPQVREMLDSRTDSRDARQDAGAQECAAEG
jgi:bacterioferritin-associated ferredoxin